MEIIIFLISITGITMAAWLFNKWLPFRICPICAGVSLTWFWIVVAITLGFLESENWQLIAAIAMGGTAVGIAYQGERRFDWARGVVKLSSTTPPRENIWRFRVPVIVAGFLFVYWAVNNIGWLSLGIETLILAAVMYVYFIAPAVAVRSSKVASNKVDELEKKLEECCD